MSQTTSSGASSSAACPVETPQRPEKETPASTAKDPKPKDPIPTDPKPEDPKPKDSKTSGGKKREKDGGENQEDPNPDEAEKK
eukprot:15430800-Alexandrium_andersonii.AAC.1